MNELAYHYNLAKLEEYFCGKRLISFTKLAEYLQVDYGILRKDKRLNELAITINKQKRIPITSIARWMS